jgi:hypothetical protein
MPFQSGLAQDTETGPLPVGRTRTPASTLQCSFDAARHLFIAADIRKGWRERRKTFGFVGNDLLPALNGHTVRVQLAILSWSDHEPRLVAAKGGDRGIGCVVDAHRITLAVKLFDEQRLFNSELQWSETKNGKPQVFRDVSPSLLQFRRDAQGDPLIDYMFKLWLIVQPPVPKPAPLYFEWSKRYFSGGLPSLGKRHS